MIFMPHFSKRWEFPGQFIGFLSLLPWSIRKNLVNLPQFNMFYHVSLILIFNARYFPLKNYINSIYFWSFLFNNFVLSILLYNCSSHYSFAKLSPINLTQFFQTYVLFYERVDEPVLVVGSNAMVFLEYFCQVHIFELP